MQIGPHNHQSCHPNFIFPALNMLESSKMIASKRTNIIFLFSNSCNISWFPLKLNCNLSFRLFSLQEQTKRENWELRSKCRKETIFMLIVGPHTNFLDILPLIKFAVTWWNQLFGAIGQQEEISGENTWERGIKSNFHMLVLCINEDEEASLWDARVDSVFFPPLTQQER